MQPLNSGRLLPVSSMEGKQREANACIELDSTFCFSFALFMSGSGKANANNSSSRLIYLYLFFLDGITGQVTTEDVQQGAEATT